MAGCRHEAPDHPFQRCVGKHERRPAQQVQNAREDTEAFGIGLIRDDLPWGQNALHCSWANKIKSIAEHVKSINKRSRMPPEMLGVWNSQGDEIGFDVVLHSVVQRPQASQSRGDLRQPCKPTVKRLLAASPTRMASLDLKCVQQLACREKSHIKAGLPSHRASHKVAQTKLVGAGNQSLGNLIFAQNHFF